MNSQKRTTFYSFVQHNCMWNKMRIANIEALI